LIVDDHPLFRQGLKSLIESDSQFEVVGESGDAHQALWMAEKFSPDMVIVDISIPGKSGLDLVSDLRALIPRSKVMIVSMHSRVDYVMRAFRAGAMGYVTKESASNKLSEALESVSKGEHFLDDSLSCQVLEKLMQSPDTVSSSTDTAYGTLTPREQEIMRLVAEGLSSKKIAEKLYISPKTVENHRANIMGKLNLHNTIELVRYAARLGLIDVERWKE
jgi:DNA-binding NarL/FixJ family response regulator